MPSSKRACFDDNSLPEDSVREILSKLPSFESAARLSCVCKSWYDWIRDNQRRDFGDELSSQIRSGCLMVLHGRGGRYQIRSHNSENIWPVNLSQDLRLFSVGECNGIICFRDPNDLHLYNPITREYMKLSQGNCSYCDGGVFGFGFNKRNNDYNILGIYKNRLREKVMVEIYRVSTNCWSDLAVDSGLSSTDDVHCSCVYVSDSCYWLNGRSSIVTFDFQTETFGHIGLPISSSDYHLFDIGVLDDSLAFCFHTWDGEINIYRNNIDSYDWTKIFRMESSFDFDIIGIKSAAWFYDTNLYHLILGGELVTLLTKEERAAQNGRIKMFRKNDTWSCSCVVFKPSLASLSSGIFLNTKISS